jgi:hypothetical protein
VHLLLYLFSSATCDWSCRCWCRGRQSGWSGRWRWRVHIIWEEAPLAETSSREDALEGAPGKKLPGRVAVTMTTVPHGNDQSRQSWRTTGGTVETVVEPACRGSWPRQGTSRWWHPSWGTSPRSPGVTSGSASQSSPLQYVKGSQSRRTTKEIISKG